MKKELDKIIFEYRKEIHEVVADLEKVEHPNEATERLMKLLELMDMEW